MSSINIFENFLANNSPVKIDNIYKYTDSIKKISGKLNKVLNDFKELDPDKAAYYAKLLLLPNPIKISGSDSKYGDYKEIIPNTINISGPDSKYREYKEILDEISTYKSKIKGIEELPFKGRETIANYSLDDSALWDVKLQKYSGSSPKLPDNPFKGLSGNTAWFPVTNVSLNYNKVYNKEFKLPNDLKLVIPKYKSEVPEISITCFDNQDSIVRKYFLNYMNSLYDDKRRVLPYKDACSELTLYIYTTDKSIKFRKKFYVVPQYDFTIKGTNNSAVTEFTIPFMVYGESNDSLEYIETTKYNPKKTNDKK